MNKMILAGTTVLYNPDESIIERMKTYANFLKKIYVIDNSEIFNKELHLKLTQSFPQSVIIAKNENFGYAKALNIAARKAIEEGFDWLLTMDQDSLFPDDLYFKAFANNVLDNVAVFSPNHKIKKSNELFFNNYKFSKIVMASGNIINLDIYTKLGGFKDSYFIDEVDTEYCFNAISNKFKIVEFINISLDHHLGDEKVKKRYLSNKTFLFSEHMPFRYYYISRNSFYLITEYIWKLPIISVKRFIDVMIIQLIRLLLYEGDKMSKIKNFGLGFFDFLRRRKYKLR